MRRGRASTVMHDPDGLDRHESCNGWTRKGEGGEEPCGRLACQASLNARRGRTVIWTTPTDGGQRDSPGQAARYSTQCGSAWAASVSRTSVISRSYSCSVKPQRIFWNRQYSR